MMKTLKWDYRALFTALALTFVLLGGCSAQPPKGATMVIQGPANDTVSWTAIQNPLSPSCSCPSNICQGGGTVTLPVGTNGQAQSPLISPVVDDSVVETVGSNPTPCMGAGFIPECPNPTTPEPVTCNALNLSAAGGQVTVSGSEEKYCHGNTRSSLTAGACPTGSTGTTACDTGTVSLTMNGQTVSTSLTCASTGFSVAFQLAQAIGKNATLASDLISAANGPLIYVNAVNTGTQYNYPWTSSNSCSSVILSLYGQCSFSAGLSPAASLASPPPHP